jgi:hypothetical protein
MGLFLYAICLFTPATRDLIPLPGLRLPAQTGPWSEISGPSTRYDVWLMSPEVALITESETWQAGDMTLRLHAHPVMLLKKDDAAWRVVTVFDRGRRIYL